MKNPKFLNFYPKNPDFSLFSAPKSANTTNFGNSGSKNDEKPVTTVETTLILLNCGPNDLLEVAGKMLKNAENLEISAKNMEKLGNFSQKVNFSAKNE